MLRASLAGAYGAFAFTFRGPKERFWQRMTITGLSLGTLAVAGNADLRHVRIRLRDVVLGVGSAAALYAIFRVGDRAARRVMPRGGEDIDQTYALREIRPLPELAARLALVIGPAEELFWRGFVQRRIQRTSGRWAGAALAAGAYGGAHVASGNATLIGAATVAGAFWSGLAAAGMPMGGPGGQPRGVGHLDLSPCADRIAGRSLIVIFAGPGVGSVQVFDAGDDRSQAGGVARSTCGSTFVGLRAKGEAK